MKIDGGAQRVETQQPGGVRTPLWFRHVARAQRVLFGSGDARTNVAGEVARLAAHRVLAISSPRQVAMLDAVTSDVDVVAHHHDVAQHVPVATALAARAVAARCRADAIVCLGGGSAIGLAKAVALELGLPIVAVPTTFSGSEATDVWGMTDNFRKTTGKDDRVLPVAIVYDPELLAELPTDMLVASGLNALAHGIDAMWAPNANPITQALSTDGIRMLAQGLPAAVAAPARTEGLERSLLGSYLTSAGFASAGSGLHHKICHLLGGAFDLPHAQTHAIVLPHVLAFNAPFAGDVMTRIGQALDGSTAGAALADLYRTLDAPTALRDLGLAQGDIAAAASMIAPTVPMSNPRPTSRADIEGILLRAWAGAAAEPNEPTPAKGGLGR